MFSIGKSDIGRVLVARSNIGICATLLGSDAGELRRDLSSRFLGSPWYATTRLLVA